MARTFAGMLRDRQADLLDEWIARTCEASVPRQLRPFAVGLTSDNATVKAALSTNWSNGQVEGHVNRLKLIKRHMYGRAKFDRLRLRVLHIG
jgi:transposase